MAEDHMLADRRSALAARLGWGHRGFRADSNRSALVALLILLALPFVLDTWNLLDPAQPPRPDIARWLGVAETLRSDPALPIYDQDLHPDYLYPPYFLTFFWMLCWLPSWAATLVFELVKWVALFVSLRCAWRICARPGEDVPPLVALGSLLLTWRYLSNDLGQGNVNIFMLLLVVSGCWLLRLGNHVAAGFVVAVGACTKVTPALLLVYFLYKRCWWTLVGAALGVVVCLVIWPSLWIGWANNWDLLWDWYNHVVKGYIEHGAVYSIHSNQSITGVLNRLLGPHVAIHYPDVYLSFTVLPPIWLNALRLTLTAAVLLTLGWATRGRLPTRQQPLAFAAEVGLVLIAMLMLSGYSWKMHFVTLIVAFSTWLAYLLDRRNPDGPRRVLKLLLIPAFLLCVMTGDILTPRGADYAEAYGAVLLGAVTTAVALLIIRRTHRRAAIGGRRI
ncbi:MAG: glycosyltransferase family 87 protein [Planctomycetota bacterium]